MKTNKIYLIGFMLILYFSFLLQGNTIITNLQDKKDNKDVVLPLIASKTLICEWYRTWGGSDYDYGYGVVVDSLDNVYVVGSTTSFGAGESDMVLIKYNENGMQQWNRKWGGAYYDEGTGVAVDSLDNIYLAGYTNSFGVGGGDMVLVKYDENGVQQWNHTWGGGNYDRGYGVAVDSSGNVYLAGTTLSFGAGDFNMVLVKYDENGEQQWSRIWGGANSDIGHGVVVDSLDNVYVTGYTNSFGAGMNDMVLLKYHGNGTQQWNHIWGGSDHDYGNEVAVDSLDNVYVAGYTTSFGAGDYDMVLVKYDGNGEQQWNRTWGGYNKDSGRGVAVDSLDNVYVTGYTSSFGAEYYNMVLVKYNENGKQQWSHMWGGINPDNGYGVAVDSLNNVYVAGYTGNFGAGYYDVVLVKYSYTERPPSDELIMILIVVVSIASAVGVGIAVTYFIRKRRKIVE